MGQSRILVVCGFDSGTVLPGFWAGDERELAIIFRDPDRVEEVTANTAVEDLEFILLNGQLSPAEQTERLTAWLRETKVHRGGHIGEYGAILLTKTGAEENSTFRDLMTGCIDEKLTEDGQYILLVTLFRETRTMEHPDDALMGMLAIQTIHALFAKQRSITTLNKYQSDIVEKYLPWLLHSQQARTLMEGKVLNGPQRARALASLNLLNKNEGISPKNRKTLADFREILRKKGQVGSLEPLVAPTPHPWNRAPL